MAKTFNPNRVGGGSVSIVRAADGTYSLKETGFDQISSLNMADLSAVAATTTAAKTETATEKTGTTTEDQTKQAFLLPKQDRGDDPFTTEKMLTSAKDLSSSLQGVDVDKGRGSITDQMYRSGNRFDADTFDDQVGSRIEEPTKIKSPTESVFGTSVDNYQGFTDKSTPQVETPQEKLAVTSANVQSGKVPAPGFTNPFKNFLGDKFKTEKGSEVTQAGKNINFDRIVDQNQAAKTATQGMGVDPTKMVPQMGSLGISADPSKTLAAKQADFASGSFPGRTVGDADLEADAGAIPRSDIQPVAKKTFAQSVNTALKGVGEAVSKLPMMQLLSTLGKQRNETSTAIAVNKSRFNVVTSSGSMQGRIVGDDGSYDPANNLFHGMNRDSAFGNLNQAGQKRIDTISRTLERQKARGQKPSEVLTARKEKFERELNDYRQDKADARDRESGNTKTNVTGFGKSGLGRDTSQGGGDTGQDNQGCVIATHAVNSGAFTPETKREAVRWCVKNLHKTWWGEAIRRGYKYYGQKAIEEGNAKNHYQEFKNYVAFGTGKKRTLKTAWTFIYRTIQFFIRGVKIKK